MGLYILVAFFLTLPDGKLHITFCNVGQGDAIYVLFPNGRDMLIDGGPAASGILSCLGQVMPFWDRTLDFVLLTHAEKDHYGGLTEVVKRYRILFVLTSESENTGPEYRMFIDALSSSSATVKKLFAGDQMTVGFVLFSVMWPSREFVTTHSQATKGQNQLSLVFHLRYGVFDAVFSGDADSAVDGLYHNGSFVDDPVEVLKVPHHGSGTGMTKRYLDWLRPLVAVISVGVKNPYHHPAENTIALLTDIRSRIARTDKHGMIRVSTDGKTWEVQTERGNLTSP